MIVTQIKQDIKAALGSISTPALVARVYGNYMVNSADPVVDLDDAMVATFGDDWESMFPE